MPRGMKAYLNRQLSSALFTPEAILAVVYPIIVDQSFIIGMAIFNTAMISSAGIAAVSAVNMVEALNLFFISLVIALATGGTVLVAQAKGKRDQQLVHQAAANTIVTVFLVASFFTLGMLIFRQPILSGIFGQSSQAVMANARIYYIGSVLSYPALALVEAACGVLRGVADTKTSFFLSFFMNLAYVLLNIGLIHFLQFGIIGMSLALNLARLGGALVALGYLLKRNQSLGITKNRLLHADWTMVKRVFVIGIPFAAEQLFFNGGKIITQIMIVGLGTFALTANALANSLTLLLEIIPGSLALALVPIVGQSIGAHDVKSVRPFLRIFLWFASGSTLLLGGVLIVTYPWLIQLFQVPTAVEQTVFGITVMMVVARTLFWPIGFLTPAALRAAGDATYTSLVSLTTMWGVRIVLGYILGIWYGYGLYGVWAAMGIEWGVRGLIFLRRFHSKRWLTKQLLP